ncbi:MAG: DUF1016 family protein, partial [Saprospiraceae bacterium]|nr:DUF1016 family protein [Saprospiraceae bacterium]
MNFYLEVLNRDYKKPHRNPSVSVILCKEKTLMEITVEIALSRSMSPTLSYFLRNARLRQGAAAFPSSTDFTKSPFWTKEYDHSFY